MTIENHTQPEEIRNALDEDEQREYLNKATGQWYVIEGGEIKQIGGDDGNEEAASEAA